MNSLCSLIELADRARGREWKGGEVHLSSCFELQKNIEKN